VKALGQFQNPGAPSYVLILTAQHNAISVVIIPWKSSFVRRRITLTIKPSAPQIVSGSVDVVFWIHERVQGKVEQVVGLMECNERKSPNGLDYRQGTEEEHDCNIDKQKKPHGIGIYAPFLLEEKNFAISREDDHGPIPYAIADMNVLNILSSRYADSESGIII
jgi:hypothetical protein